MGDAWIAALRTNPSLLWTAALASIVDWVLTTLLLAISTMTSSTLASQALGVSSGCSECYATNGEFASKNCKAACLLGWCKQGCLDCSTAAAPKAALDSCTGFTSGSADPCLESTTTGACSADEQAALSDSATVGKAGSDCGLGAYNVLTGAFNHDKFNTCFTGKLSIGSGCSECYAANGEFAAKNCKAACLLGW